MKIFYDVRYESINNLEPLSIGMVSEIDNSFYGEQICNISKTGHKENFVFYQNENEKNKVMNFAPRTVYFCDSTHTLSLNLRYWLSKYSNVEFVTLSNDCYQQFVLNTLLYKYKELAIQQPDLPFPDSLNILGINYNLSQDISRYLEIDRPATVEEINKLLFTIGINPYRIHTNIRDNSLYLAKTYKDLYKKIS